MSDREQDKRVAEILGYSLLEEWHGTWAKRGKERERILPRFTTDARYDYEVLEWVREQPNEFQFSFRLQLSILFHSFGEPMSALSRPVLGEIAYIAGDYSRALLALDEQGLLR